VNLILQRNPKLYQESEIKSEFLNFEPQIDGTYDSEQRSIQDQADDSGSFLSSGDHNQNCQKGPDQNGVISPNGAVLKNSLKLCEICGKSFEGKNR